MIFIDLSIGKSVEFTLPDGEKVLVQFAGITKYGHVKFAIQANRRVRVDRLEIKQERDRNANRASDQNR